MLRRSLDLRIGIPVAILVGAGLAVALDPLAVIAALAFSAGPLLGLGIIWSVVRWLNVRSAAGGRPANRARPIWVLFAAIASLSLVCSTRVIVRSYYRGAAVREIQRRGGRVDRHTGGPAWLYRYFDGDVAVAFDVVYGIDLNSRPFSDGDVRYLNEFPELQRLSLHGTQLTDVGLQNLAGLKRLEELAVSATAITDAGLEHLANVPELRSLNVSQTAITDAGLQPLAKLRHLEELSIYETRVGAAGLKAICEMPALRGIHLRNTGVGDADLQQLEGLKLDLLSLDATQLTEKGSAILEALPVRSLFLVGPEVGDGHLARLQRLPRLRILYLIRTSVTEAGLTQLPKLRELETVVLNGKQVTAHDLARLSRAQQHLDISE